MLGVGLVKKALDGGEIQRPDPRWVGEQGGEIARHPGRRQLSLPLHSIVIPSPGQDRRRPDESAACLARVRSAERASAY